MAISLLFLMKTRPYRLMTELLEVGIESESRRKRLYESSAVIILFHIHRQITKPSDEKTSFKTEIKLDLLYKT
jgi:hypothetical protein